jgi:branched-chain amino acid transport system ATP-binding protein
MVQERNEIILELKQLSKYVRGQTLLKDINLKVPEGEILGIVGPNGAGKTSLLNLISGQIQPSKGSIVFRGRDITDWPPHRRCHAGIGRTFQIPRPFPEMSATENLLIGLWFGKEGGVAEAQQLDQAQSLLELVGIPHKAETLGRDLTLSEQRRLEVARALATGPRLLLLDEIAAGLSPKAVKQVVKLVEKLQAQGLTLVLIDHFLNLTMEVSHRLIALDQGEKIMVGPPLEVIHHPEVVSAYLGTRENQEMEEVSYGT